MLEEVFLEPFFILSYYHGMQWETYLKFPIAFRRWLLERINKEITTANENDQQPPTKAPHQNTNDIRSFTGNNPAINRTTAPRLQRFR